MSMTFDATLKDLGAAHPAAFLTLFDGPPSAPSRLLNVDLSTVTASADLVVGLGEPLREIVHIDFQSSANAAKGRDVLAYNALLYRNYDVPVHSVLVLLRPRAAHSAANGTVAYAPRPGRGRMDFGYEVVRLWECPAEDLLRGPPGTLPLAILGTLPEGAELGACLRGVALRLAERLGREAEPALATRLLTAAYLLAGLRVRRDEAKAIFKGVSAVSESDTYFGVLEEGAEQQIKKDIRRLARKRLGQEDEPTRARLQDISDMARLERILDRLVDPVPPSWEELLDTP